MRGKITVAITSYWHPGTGRCQGSHVDAITHRNAQQLPSLPGRSLKGLVRDAVYRWEQCGAYAQPKTTEILSITEQLFGPYGKDGSGTWPGLLRFGDAQLPQPEAEYLAANRELVTGLYRGHFSTAIEHETSTAQNKSLRGIELVVPLTLYATVDLVPNAKHRNLHKQWLKLVQQALPLVRAVGAQRSRGLGRAVLTLEELR